MKYTIERSRFVHFFTTDKTTAPLWFIVRLYLGYVWFMAGWEKVINPAWFGSGAGAAMKGFVGGALGKTGGLHPDVQSWYASFLQSAVLPYPVIWSYAITIGELLVGVGLIVGLFTGTAAFFAFLMNINFMLAGTVSVNPIWLILALGIMSAHRVAGYWGLDRYTKPFLHRILHRRQTG